MVHSDWRLHDAAAARERAHGGGPRDAVARRAEAQAVVRAERTIARATGVLNTLAGADVPHLHAAVRRCALTSLHSVFSAVASGADDGAARPPTEVGQLARLWAQMRLGLAPLLRGVRLGHGELSQVWLEEMAEADLEPAVRDALLRSSTRVFFDYADRLAGALAAGYERERASMRVGPEQRRLGLVRQLIAGHEVDEEALGYRLEAEHIGMVGWGPNADRDVRALAAALRGRALFVSVSEELVWAWVRGAWCRDRGWRRRLERVAPLTATVAVGAPARGADGFRQTHSEALGAGRVAARRSRPLTLYKDVSLEALAIGDEELASVFVSRELGPLAGQDARAVRLRTTLRVYLSACGQNAAATAAALGVHDQTVRYHLRAIEDRLGSAIAHRHAELAAALRLHALFDKGGAQLAHVR